ncbi:MAG: ArnT family glycosyltransferase [Acidiferrobacterales bacterium]
MSIAADDRTDFNRKLFYITLFSTLVLKVILAATVPVTADEAYFIGWGQHLSYGYYDHPPLIGWILYLLLKLGHSTLLLRSPAVAMSTIIGVGIYLLLRRYDRSRAYLISVLYMVSPIGVLGVLITTDTPLIICSFLSAAFLFKALMDKSAVYYLLSGVFLGLAFISKYFTVLLIGAYIAYYLFSDRDRIKTRGFVLLFAASLPFGLINLYWNYTHCWDNILFNLVTRNQGMHLSLIKFLTYIGIVVYLVTPPIIYFLVRHWRELAVRARASELKIFVYAAAIPFAFFLVLSTNKDIGLHWPLSFYAFVFVALAIYLTSEELVKATKFMAYFTAFHLVLVTVGLAMPLKDWKFTKHYDSIVFTERNQVLRDAMAPYAGNFYFATDRYTTSSLMSYFMRQDVFVFGGGSYHGRQDDIYTDFRKFAGKNILILTKSAPAQSDYAPYFRSIEIKKLVIEDTPYFMVLGRDFNYASYRKNVLGAIMTSYYAIPGWLPCKRCYMDERYGSH